MATKMIKAIMVEGGVEFNVDPYSVTEITAEKGAPGCCVEVAETFLYEIKNSASEVKKTIKEETGRNLKILRRRVNRQVEGVLDGEAGFLTDADLSEGDETKILPVADPSDGG